MMGDAVRLYRYVGPKRIADRAPPEPAGVPIGLAGDVLDWVRESGQEATGPAVATFVVDADGRLLVADRRSEHVACAGGRVVRSAGEITFSLDESIEVIAVSNQSTGYCPEPESWPAVAAALTGAGLVAPNGFDPACVFRRCPACEGINLVKAGAFECAVCGGDLPATYNVQ